MTEIGEVYGIKIYVDAMAPSNEAWLMQEDKLAIYKEIRRLQRMLECSGVRITGIMVVAD